MVDRINAVAETLDMLILRADPILYKRSTRGTPRPQRFDDGASICMWQATPGPELENYNSCLSFGIDLAIQTGLWRADCFAAYMEVSSTNN
jgi:hypothetical protein